MFYMQEILKNNWYRNCLTPPSSLAESSSDVHAWEHRQSNVLRDSSRKHSTERDFFIKIQNEHKNNAVDLC